MTNFNHCANKNFSTKLLLESWTPNTGRIWIRDPVASLKWHSACICLGYRNSPQPGTVLKNPSELLSTSLHWDSAKTFETASVTLVCGRTPRWHDCVTSKVCVPSLSPSVCVFMLGFFFNAYRQSCMFLCIILQLVIINGTFIAHFLTNEDKLHSVTAIF